MFLKSIKHVHKLSPSGRERESEHMWGLYNYCFLVGKNARVWNVIKLKKKMLEDFYSNFQFKWDIIKWMWL